MRTLIEKIMSENTLAAAVKAVRRNRGVDRMEVAEMEIYMQEHKEELQQLVVEMKYRPKPVRRECIPKPNGKRRLLGIPAAVDRVVQQAAALVLGPILRKASAITTTN